MRVSGNDDRVLATVSGHELADADQLIADLAALRDAGLVVVHEHVLGPARYGVAPIADHLVQRQHRARSRQAGMTGGGFVE
jgi:hypothetical protein